MSHSEIGTLNAIIGKESPALAFRGDTAVLQHVAIMRDAQHLSRVLFGDKDRGAGAVDPFDDVEDELKGFRRETERGLVHQKTTWSRHQRPPDGKHLLL